MKKIFTDIYSGVMGSLDNQQKGFSGKKLTAISIMACVIAAHIKWLSMGDFSQLVPVLYCDFGFVSVLFGINVVDKFKNKDGTNPPNTETKETIETTS